MIINASLYPCVISFSGEVKIGNMLKSPLICLRSFEFGGIFPLFERLKNSSKVDIQEFRDCKLEDSDCIFCRSFEPEQDSVAYA